MTEKLEIGLLNRAGDTTVVFEDPSWINFTHRGLVVHERGRLVFYNWRIVAWWACPDTLAPRMVDESDHELGALVAATRAASDAP